MPLGSERTGERCEMELAAAATRPGTTDLIGLHRKALPFDGIAQAHSTQARQSLVEPEALQDKCGLMCTSLSMYTRP